MSDDWGLPTCTHHNDQQRTECPVCLVTALTAERDQLRFNINNEMTWASHYLAQSIAEKARADKAEAVLSDPQQLHAHCLRNLNEGQIAHLFGERMTAIFNRAERAEADAERYRLVTLRQDAELAAERARLNWLEQKKPRLLAMKDYASGP